MAKAAPTRGQFPRGMKGDVMFRNAEKKYKESYGPPAPKTPKPEGRVNRRGRFIPSKPKAETKKEETPTPQPRTINQSGGENNKGSGGGGGGSKPKPKTDERNKAYQAARDKIKTAQGKDAKAKATTNAEIVGLKAFIKAHKDKKGMSKAVAAAKAKLAKKEGASTKTTSSKPFGSGATYASSKVKTKSNIA